MSYLIGCFTDSWSYIIYRSRKSGSGQPKFLHSAVFLDRIMFVFGGNTHNDTNLSQGAKCYSTDLMAYDPGMALFFGSLRLIWVM